MWTVHHWLIDKMQSLASFGTERTAHVCRVSLQQGLCIQIGQGHIPADILLAACTWASYLKSESLFLHLPK